MWSHTVGVNFYFYLCKRQKIKIHIFPVISLATPFTLCVWVWLLQDVDMCVAILAAVAVESWGEFFSIRKPVVQLIESSNRCGASTGLIWAADFLALVWLCLAGFRDSAWTLLAGVLRSKASQAAESSSSSIAPKGRTVRVPLRHLCSLRMISSGFYSTAFVLLMPSGSAGV